MAERNWPAMFGFLDGMLTREDRLRIVETLSERADGGYLSDTGRAVLDTLSLRDAYASALSEANVEDTPTACSRCSGTGLDPSGPYGEEPDCRACGGGGEDRGEPIDFGEWQAEARAERMAMAVYA